MNTLRQTISTLFEAPMQGMSFVAYFQYINTNGKITARSLMEIVCILATYAEEQERINEKNEANFKEIESILAKLIDKKLDEKVDEKPIQEDPMSKAINEAYGYNCATCGKTLSTKLALAGHSRSHKKTVV